MKQILNTDAAISNLKFEILKRRKRRWGGQVAILYVLCAGAVFHSRGAAITWSAATNITGDADVITTGVLAYSYSWAGFPTNVNGVPFSSPTGNIAAPNILTTNQMDVDAVDFTSSSNPFASLSAAYKKILVGAAFLASPTTNVITLSNLTAGNNYVVQLWVSDPRGPENSRNETLTNAGGNSVTLNFSVNRGSSTPGGPGQYAVGTFTADANVQAFSVKPDTVNNVAQLNAIQVRDTSELGVPTLDRIATSGATSRQLIFHGPGGQHYTLLTTTNLATPLTNWQALANGTGVFGASPVTNVDSHATNKSQFYRVRSP